MFYAYVLESEKDSKRYYGVTGDLNRRIKQHNSGKVFSTKNRRPLKLVYFEEFENFKDARDREVYFKSGSGREFINLELGKRGPVV